jgi:hypothetical protein
MKMKYSRFRELWAVPKYKLMFKFGAWILFFVIFFMLAAWTGDGERTPSMGSVYSYARMKRNMIENSLTIRYQISADKEFLIIGTRINGVISGTLEFEDELHRIRITDEQVFIVTQDEEEETNILSRVKLAFLFPENIIEIINALPSSMSEELNQRIYSYTADDVFFTLYVNETEVYKIVILDGTITYEMEFETIN